MRILLTGGSGRLGRALLACRWPDGVGVIAPTRRELDITDRQSCRAAMHRYCPDIVIHAAAFADAARAESLKPWCWDLNVNGTRNLTIGIHDTRVVFISTDYVFDGVTGNYSERDFPAPLNYYGLTKTVAEAIIFAHPWSLIIRAPFRADPPWPFERAIVDQWTSCRFASEVAPDIIRAALMLDLTGVIHIGGPRRSIYEMARDASPEVGQITRAEIEAETGLRLPRDTSLDSSKWHSLPKASQQSFRLAETLTATR